MPNVYLYFVIFHFLLLIFKSNRVKENFTPHATFQHFHQSHLKKKAPDIQDNTDTSLVYLFNYHSTCIY